MEFSFGEPAVLRAVRLLTRGETPTSSSGRSQDRGAGPRFRLILLNQILLSLNEGPGIGKMPGIHKTWQDCQVVDVYIRTNHFRHGGGRGMVLLR